MDSPSKLLPPPPDLAPLKHQAEDLRKAFNRGDSDARQRVRSVAHLRDVADTQVELTVSQAQLVVAREYNFASWPELKAHVEMRATVKGESMTTQEKAASSDLVVAGAMDYYQPVDGNVVVEAGGQLRLYGATRGTITVRTDGAAALFGPIGGTLLVEPGGTADVYGPGGGTVVNQGGTIEIHGPVGGSVKAEGGATGILAGVVIGGDLIVENGATVEI